MVKFYKIPVTERQIEADKKPLINILKTQWPLTGLFSRRTR